MPVAVRSEPLPVEGISEAGDPDFNATPSVDIPLIMFNPLRMIRVAMQESINNIKFKVRDGFVVVADLVVTMTKIFQTLMCVEQVALIINRHGVEFFQICFLGK